MIKMVDESILDYIIRRGGTKWSFFQVIRTFCYKKYNIFLFGHFGKDNIEMYEWLYRRENDSGGN